MAVRRRSWLHWVPALAAVTGLVACSGPPPEDPIVPLELPTATAPPDPGIAPPVVELLATGGPVLAPEDRPQRQLTAWSEALADELNIPRAALQAYGFTQRTLERTDPSCGLSWTVLAGIGAVESSHGRHGGAKLDITGRPSQDIIGLPLDGSEGVKRIEDTDGGELDGDTVFDRAVGPLQFIPTTWQKWAVDGDGDGVADPHDIDDAALAAAHYVCSEGADLRDPEDFWASLLEYNESRSYVQEVLDFADHFGRTSKTVAVE
ncbi:lytic murein transglycosylase [Saccharopolyspora sp. CA-218241]|uniref:lytic murein transglycosylase n=1 Tax=Saccharopolyspora sp. CA-218241 TaxID=3240027 RepID=UPI003D97FC60